MAAIEDLYLLETSWSVKRFSDSHELGAIYLNAEDATRAYMATNGIAWSHEATLDEALAWIAEHPRQDLRQALADRARAATAGVQLAVKPEHLDEVRPTDFTPEDFVAQMLAQPWPARRED